MPTYGRQLGTGTGTSSGSSGGYEQLYAADAATVLGVSTLSGFHLEFASGKTGTIFGAVGSGDGGATLQDNVDAVNAMGGVIVMNTGATASSNVNWQNPSVAGRGPTLNYNNSAIKFYRAARFAMQSTVDAQTVCWSGSPNWRAGVIGSVSSTKFAVSIGVVQQASLVSTISIDQTWHILRQWYDGVSCWLSVDGETPVSVSASGLFPINGGPLQSVPQFLVGNGTTAANRKVYWNWSCWYCATS